MNLETNAVVPAIPHSRRRSDDGKLITEPVDVSNFRFAGIVVEMGNFSPVDEEVEGSLPVSFQWQCANREDAPEEDWVDHNDPIIGIDLQPDQFVSISVIVTHPFMRMVIDRGAEQKVSFWSGMYILVSAQRMPHNVGIPFVASTNGYADRVHLEQGTLVPYTDEGPPSPDEDLHALGAGRILNSETVVI